MLPYNRPKRLFELGEKKNQLCAVTLANRKENLKDLLKMVAMATVTDF